jgi:hypothetical protein
MGKTTTISLPFDQGLAQQEAVEWLDSGASASGILNGNFTKQFAVDKRLGMGLISTGAQVSPGGSPYPGALAQGIRACSWSRGALAAAGIDVNGNGALYVVQDVPPAAGQNIIPLGPLPTPRVVRRGLPATQSTNSAGISTIPVLVDVPRGTSFARFAFYAQGAATWMTIVDANTGDLIQAPKQVYATAPNTISAVYLPNAPAASQVAVLLFFSGSPGTAVGLQISASGTTVTSKTPFSAYTADIAPWVGHPSGDFYLLYQSAAGVMTMQANNSVWTTQNNQFLETFAGTSSPCQIVATYGTTEMVAALYENAGGNMRFAQIKGDGSYTVVVAPETLLSGVVTIRGLARAQGTGGVFFAHWLSPSGNANLNTSIGTYGLISAGVLTIYGNSPLGMLPVGKPFVMGSTIFQPCMLQLFSNTPPGTMTTVSEQVSLYLLAYTSTSSTLPPLVVASVAVRQVDPWFVGTGILTPNVSQAGIVGATRFAVGLKTYGNDLPGVGQSFGPAWSADFEFDTTDQDLALFQAVEVSGDLVLSGAVPMLSDGTQTRELGFFMYPEFLAATTAAGSSNVLTGTYFWAIVYKSTDASGQTTRSAPVFTQGTGLVLASGTTAAPVLAITPLGVTYNDLAASGQVQAEIYRTLAGGSTFYFNQSVAISGMPGVGVVNFTDTTPDTEINTATVLYTTGGILDSVNPPAASCLCVHKQRLWLVDETQRVIWFSKSFAPGEAPSFNETNTIPFAQGGDITGLFSLDDKLLVGKLSGLFVIYGDGPADTGQGSDLTIPQGLAGDSGPIDWRAGCVYPEGLLYRSATGIMLCDRSLNISWIGKDVTDTLALYPTVLSSTLVPTATQVRFTCANAAGATVTLCYDYLAEKWVQHTYPFQAAGVASTVMALATASHPASYASLTSDGALWQEHATIDAAPYLDDDTTGAHHFNPTTVISGWIKLQGVQGYQRARFAQLFFEEADDCGVTISVATNYSSAIQQSKTWGSNIVDELPNNIVHLHIGAQLMMQAALQISVSDVQGTNMVTGKGARFVSLNVELSQENETYRQVPAIGRG